jgi:formylmethanofuran dehydrogenase subunit E
MTPLPAQISCFECGRQGWSDEMGMQNEKYMCAICMYPDIDFSGISPHSEKS